MASVLIADDNEDAATSLAILLRLEGHEVATAYDGEQALERLAEYRPEAVILDLGMPRRDGLEVCQSIRNQPWGRKVRIIALTGWGTPEDRRKTAECGFDAHLVKPVDLPVLLSLLAQPA